MALEASHIRFAIDIKDDLLVTDVKKYVSGVIYPDTRYLTGVDRNITHPQSLLHNGFTKLDDFEKGNYAHVVYDKILETYTTDTLTDIFTDIGEFTGQGSEYWIRLTALKILQDIDDVKAFPIKIYLPYLDYVENKNGEDESLLQKYNGFFQQLYANPQNYTAKNALEMWDFLGVKGNNALTLQKRTKEFQNDATINRFIKEVYAQTLKMWKETN